MDCSPPDSSVHGILQATIVEWVAIPLSRGFSQLRDSQPGSPALQADSLLSEQPGKSLICGRVGQLRPDSFKKSFCVSFIELVTILLLLLCFGFLVKRHAGS